MNAGTRVLAVIVVCVVAGVATVAQTVQKPIVTEADQTCHLSGPLAKRLMAAGSAVDRDAEYYLVSLGEVKRRDGKTLLVLKDKYAPGLVSLADFSHVMVFYWFDRNDTPENRSCLQWNRRGKKDPLTSVFATRSAVRPNLIAITTCRIASIKGNIVEIDGIDAFDGSPILDLKPYIPRNDVFLDAQIPEWVRQYGGTLRRTASGATPARAARGIAG